MALEMTKAQKTCNIDFSVIQSEVAQMAVEMTKAQHTCNLDLSVIQSEVAQTVLEMTKAQKTYNYVPCLTDLSPTVCDPKNGCSGHTLLQH